MIHLNVEFVVLMWKDRVICLMAAYFCFITMAATDPDFLPTAYILKYVSKGRHTPDMNSKTNYRELKIPKSK